MENVSIRAIFWSEVQILVKNVKFAPKAIFCANWETENI